MPRTARDPVATRRSLLDAALRVIREKGFVATSVDELCAAAGVSKGAFFHHFTDKEALAVAAAEYFSDGAAELFAAAPHRELADPRDRLFGYLAMRRALLDGALPDVTCLLGTMVQEVYDTHPAVREACAFGIGAHAGTLVADIASAKARHAPTADWDPESLALHTQAVIQGAFVLAKAAGDTRVAVDALDHLERYLRCLLPDIRA
ncbi:MAG: TetR/AcrR family transcriptional regulator [Siculibacillus sp.]|nr:TetR/AcrR family transcriptional regulator [Siculibacillus sp.]